ncbi:hypothetical protein BHE74_00039142 [Ensete ventricosum]|nr:hypothetical protein GW17_00046990 [Ensete ventricosum]RWW54287.1 hypothetical protein BHE74_00039142 [Ensete ventricosum]
MLPLRFPNNGIRAKPGPLQGRPTTAKAFSVSSRLQKVVVLPAAKPQWVAARDASVRGDRQWLACKGQSAAASLQGAAAHGQP